MDKKQVIYLAAATLLANRIKSGMNVEAIEEEAIFSIETARILYDHSMEET